VSSSDDNFNLKDVAQNNVLLDFTTLSTVDSLLDNYSLIKSQHIFDLATFLEAVVFHDQIIVLSDTGYGLGKIIGRKPLEKLESYKDLKKLITEDKREFITIDEFLDFQNARFCQEVLPKLGRFNEMKTLYEDQFQPTSRLNQSRALKNLDISEDNYPVIGQYYRANMYWNYATNDQLIYKPHSLRIPFLANLISFQEYRNQSVFDSINELMDIFFEIENEKDWNFSGTGYRLTLPMMLRIVLYESESIDDIIPKALELRKDAEDYRNWCRKANNALYGEGSKEYKNDLVTILTDAFPESSTYDTYEIRQFPRWFRNLLSLNLERGFKDIEDTLKKEPYRKDLAFLLNVKKRAEGIVSSRKDYLKIFGQKPPEDIFQFAEELKAKNNLNNEKSFDNKDIFLDKPTQKLINHLKELGEINISPVRINIGTNYGNVIGKVNGNINNNYYKHNKILNEIFQPLEWNEEKRILIEKIEEEIKHNQEAINQVQLDIQKYVEDKKTDKSFIIKLKKFASDIPTGIISNLITSAIWAACGH